MFCSSENLFRADVGILRFRLIRTARAADMRFLVADVGKCAARTSGGGVDGGLGFRQMTLADGNAVEGAFLQFRRISDRCGLAPKLYLKFFQLSPGL
jgi:hypothetical protein